MIKTLFPFLLVVAAFFVIRDLRQSASEILRVYDCIDRLRQAREEGF